MLMDKPLRIAIAGQMRSGKDTAVEYLLLDNGGVHMKFADPVYEMASACQCIAGFPEIKDRTLLQYLGTEFGRAQDANVWIKVFKRRLDLLDANTNVVVSDARFENEFEFLRDNGFTLVKVKRPDYDRFLAGASHEDHASEQDVKTYQYFDYTIDNSGTKKGLYSALNTIVECIELD